MRISKVTDYAALSNNWSEKLCEPFESDSFTPVLLFMVINEVDLGANE